MTQPKRSLEEIAESVLTSPLWNRDGSNPREVVLAALREAADAARQEEREALRTEMTSWIEDITRGRVLAPELLFKTDVLEWLDDRSRGEEPKP